MEIIEPKFDLFHRPKSCLLPLHHTDLISFSFTIDVSVLLCNFSVSFNHTKSDAGFAACYCKWFNQTHSCTIRSGEVEILPRLVLRYCISHQVAKNTNLNILVTLLM
jgi:hypothetical protein